MSLLMVLVINIFQKAFFAWLTGVYSQTMNYSMGKLVKFSVDEYIMISELHEHGPGERDPRAPL